MSTGPWDDQLHNSFTLYKGDVTPTPLSFVLNDDGDQAIANAAVNPDEYDQDVVVRLAFSQGLFSQASNATTGNATVNFTIEFAEVGTEDWVGYGIVTEVRDKGVPLPDSIANANLKPFDIADGYTKLPQRSCGYAEVLNEEEQNGIERGSLPWQQGESIVAYRDMSDREFPTGTYWLGRCRHAMVTVSNAATPGRLLSRSEETRTIAVP